MSIEDLSAQPNLNSTSDLHDVVEVTSEAIPESTESLVENMRLNRTSSNLAGMSSKVSASERLQQQAQNFGLAAFKLVSSLNIALFTPIELSFGMVSQFALEKMVISVNKFYTLDEEERKRKRNKNQKKEAKNRLKYMMKKMLSYGGFVGGAILLGAFGSVAAAAALSINESLSLQEEIDQK